MWCSNCQQDMPSVAHPATGRMVCTRCQRTMRTRKPDHSTQFCDGGIALDDPVASAAAATLPRIDDWPTRQSVHHLGRELRRPTSLATGTPQTVQQGRWHFDPPHNLVDSIERSAPASFPPVAPEVTTRALSKSRRTEITQLTAWLIVLAGTLVLAAGIGLVAWSLSATQVVYWNLALGLTLGGQGTLIFGLVLIVSRLWRNSRHATLKLNDVHARLGQLQHTADALTATRNGGAPAFYAELVRGASPQVLLANLKGQLDQLATRIGSIG